MSACPKPAVVICQPRIEQRIDVGVSTSGSGVYQYGFSLLQSRYFDERLVCSSINDGDRDTFFQGNTIWQLVDGRFVGANISSHSSLADVYNAIPGRDSGHSGTYAAYYAGRLVAKAGPLDLAHSNHDVPVLSVLRRKIG